MKKMSVKRATIAFDMDLIENDRVLDSVYKLANLLLANDIKVYIAVWNGKQAKGIDDALTSNTKVYVSELK